MPVAGAALSHTHSGFCRFGVFSYRYVSSINVARDTTWGEVSGFALANGGIAFQTCSGDTYLITHYEPVYSALPSSSTVSLVTSLVQEASE